VVVLHRWQDTMFCHPASRGLQTGHAATEVGSEVLCRAGTDPRFTPPGPDPIITAELGRRVIQVINYTEISHNKGRSVPAKYE